MPSRSETRAGAPEGSSAGAGSKNQPIQPALEAWIEKHGKDGEVYQVWECRSPRFRAEATVKAVKEDA